MGQKLSGRWIPIHADIGETGKWGVPVDDTQKHLFTDYWHAAYSYCVASGIAPDLVFIDGWHTFDYTLVDAFYANELLRVGGYLVIDDAQHSGVAKCVRYIEPNYKSFYKRLPTHRTIAAFCKTAEDTREWNFHAGF